MATFHLPSTLRTLAGGLDRVEVPGGTVGEALRQLERAHPRLAGWVLDEGGALRRHVSLFVNEEQAAPESPVAPGDQVHIVPAISGGASGNGGPVGHVGDAGEVEVLAGTRKGLFVLRGPRGGRLAVVARRFAGQPVEYAVRDPRSGLCFASVTHSHFGPKLFVSPDPEAADDAWEQAAGPAFPPGIAESANIAESAVAVERIWIVEPGVEEGVLWAGVAPAALFRSADGGRSWELVKSLWEEPSRKAVESGRRRPLPAFDLPLAGRAGEARGGDLRRGGLVDRGWRGELAAGGLRPRPPLRPRGGAGGDLRALHP